MRRIWLSFAAFLLLSGCASVQISKVPASQTPKIGDSVEGIRFYQPRPYLLVTKGVPPVQSVSEGGGGQPGDGGKQGAGGNQGDGSKKGKATGGKQSATGKKGSGGDDPAPSSYTPNQLYVQLIWLPDMNVSYAVNPKSGIGTLDTSMQLKDGWQLTQFGGKIDTKVPETITALGSLLGAIRKGGAAGTPSPSLAAPSPPEEKWIEPGLYRFEFESVGDGFVARLKRVTIDLTH